MRTRGMVPFNGTRLSEAAQRRNTSVADIQRRFGLSNSYFASRAKQFGTIYMRDAALLKEVYGIMPEEYAPETAAPANDVVDQRKVMREVVKGGINERFSNDEFIKAFQAIVRPAVRAVMMDERTAIIEAVTEAVKAALE